MSLRLHTDKHGQPTPVRTVAFGAPISDPAEVAERIRRAQRAILNPSAKPKGFLNGDDEAAPEITFSRNCVSLEISGPDVVDLSFVDLPGRVACSSPLVLARVLIVVVCSDRVDRECRD